jgi:hypothetical protein
MYTVEMDHDEVTVTILDDYGHHEDVVFNIFDDIVYIRQWDDFLETFNSIAMSPEMFEEFVAALNSAEGAYKIKRLTKE